MTMQILTLLPHLLWGALVTLELVLLSGLGILLVGFLASLAKLSRFVIIRLPVSLYVDLSRSIPLLVLLFLIVFALPDLGIRLSVFWGAILGLVLYYGAYQAEICRAGIQAVDKGQVEAAIALGMRPAKVMLRITFPQALRVILPPTASLFIGALKGSAQVAVIGLPELLRTGNSLAVASGNFFSIYGVVVLIYLLMTYQFSFLTGRLEKRLRIHD
jgi:His/Glu/Gln/Arg/opine family amino acid ABC transporter permease subunit